MQPQGGENHTEKPNLNPGYSVKAHCTGEPQLHPIKWGGGLNSEQTQSSAPKETTSRNSLRRVVKDRKGHFKTFLDISRQKKTQEKPESQAEQRKQTKTPAANADRGYRLSRALKTPTAHASKQSHSPNTADHTTS
jgi:hypothetical protein